VYADSEMLNEAWTKADTFDVFHAAAVCVFVLCALSHGFFRGGTAPRVDLGSKLVYKVFGSIGKSIS
jgi:hypothetical protein